jgi:hypothetical protein
MVCVRGCFGLAGWMVPGLRCEPGVSLMLGERGLTLIKIFGFHFQVKYVAGYLLWMFCRCIFRDR